MWEVNNEFKMDPSSASLAGLPPELKMEIMQYILLDGSISAGVRLRSASSDMRDVFDQLLVWKTVIDRNKWRQPDGRTKKIGYSYIAPLIRRKGALCANCLRAVTDVTWVHINLTDPSPLCQVCVQDIWWEYPSIRRRSMNDPTYLLAKEYLDGMTRTQVLKTYPLTRNDLSLLRLYWYDNKQMYREHHIIWAAWVKVGGQPGLEAYWEKKEREKQRKQDRLRKYAKRLFCGVIEAYDPSLSSEDEFTKVDDQLPATLHRPRGIILDHAKRVIIKTMVRKGILDSNDDCMLPLKENFELASQLLTNGLKRVDLIEKVDAFTMDQVLSGTVDWAARVSLPRLASWQFYIQSNVYYVSRMMEIKSIVMRDETIPESLKERHLDAFFLKRFRRRLSVDGLTLTSLSHEANTFTIEFDKNITLEALTEFMHVMAFALYHERPQLKILADTAGCRFWDVARQMIRSFIEDRVSGRQPNMDPLTEDELVTLPTKYRDFAENNLRRVIQLKVRHQISATLQALVDEPESEIRGLKMKHFTDNLPPDRALLKLIKKRALRALYDTLLMPAVFLRATARQYFDIAQTFWFQRNTLVWCSSRIRKGDFRHPSELADTVRPVPVWLWAEAEKWLSNEMNYILEDSIIEWLRNIDPQATRIPKSFSVEAITMALSYTKISSPGLKPYLESERFTRIADDEWYKTKVSIHFIPRVISSMGLKQGVPTYRKVSDEQLGPLSPDEFISMVVDRILKITNGGPHQDLKAFPACVAYIKDIPARHSALRRLRNHQGVDIKLL